jgi:murein DD-endopeptidase MepM/ murein hydrolase activator NlpD
MPKGADGSSGGFDPIALFNSHADRLDNLIIAMRSLPLSEPLEDYEITSPFGSRDDPFNEQSAFHEGVDFGAPLNSPVMATGDGVVTWAGWRDKYGIMVEIDHGRGLSTRYAHLGRTLVHTGDHVSRGRPIGLLGNTGRSTGPHLHYEVRVNDQATDPMKFITAGRDVLKNE